MILSDVAAEKAVLSSIFRYGSEAYYDVSDIINSNTFTVPINGIIYSCIQKLYIKESNPAIDIASILSVAKEIGCDNHLNNPAEISHLSAITKFPISSNSGRKFAAKIRKLEIARLMHDQLELTQDKYLNIKGDEPISHILGLAEESIFDFTSLLNDNDDSPQLVFDGIKEFLEQKAEHPVDQMGIPTGFDWYDFAIGGGLRKGTVNVIGARPKALRYGSKVYTKNGPINIEDVVIGQTILHPKYGETTVTKIWDHYNIPIYRIYFRDGDFVDCCESHLWHVYKRYPYNNEKKYLKTTKELMNDLIIGKNKAKKEYKWDIPLPSEVFFDEQEINIDPYALGVLLGDGSISKTCVYHTADDEIHEYMKKYFNSIGIEVKIDNHKKDSKCISYRANGFQDYLRKENILGKNCYNKFIPKNYIYNSKDVRLKVLAGLLDTDGDCTIDKRSGNSRIRFCSVSYQLCLDVKELVQSLGGLCSIKENKRILNKKIFNSYRCEIRMPNNINPFRLKRKAEKYSERKIGKLKRTITKIERIAIDNARCLTLSDDDGLFMTDNYVITHNTGKTVFGMNVAINIAKKGIPVLYLDSEMLINDHKTRGSAMLSFDSVRAKTTINEVETGKFGEHYEKKQLLIELCDQNNKIPFYHKNIGVGNFEDQLSIMRRWLAKTVKLNDHGKANDCVIIYDYLKLTDSNGMEKADLAEYQMLGFMLTALHNFSIRYEVPILLFTQLNRDGITKETTDTASGSDRVIWLCSNFSIYKDKSDDEIAKYGIEYGNKKLVPVIARHGEGLPFGDFIHIDMHKRYAKLIEKGTAFKPSDSKETSNVIEEDIAF